MNNTEHINYPGPKQEYKVLVRCFTFNQCKYIEDALNGFAIQQTNFPYVCLVMDDASTDGEQEVIKKWMERECDMSRAETFDIPTSVVIIVPHKNNQSCTFAFYLLKQNLYGTGERKMKHVYPWRYKCEYEALCEGDDYWIDPLKLQKQVDFLEVNMEYSLCFHRVKTIYEKGCVGKDVFSHVKPGEYTLDYILHRWTVPTCSMLYRKDILKYKPENSNFKYGDNVLLLTCFSQGKVYCIDGDLGVYRRNLGGWTMNKSRIALSKEQYIHINALLESFPNLSLDYLKKKKVFYSAYIKVYDEELSTEWKQKTRHDFSSFPMQYIVQYLKYKIRKLLGRK